MGEVRRIAIAPEAASALLARMPTSIRAERAARYTTAMASVVLYKRRGWTGQERAALNEAYSALTMPEQQADEACALCLTLHSPAELHRRGAIALCGKCYVDANEFETAILSD